jgi:hypothetical protein
MLVVIGPVRARRTGEDVVPDGLTVGIAMRAAAEGSRVEVITKLGDDGLGDAVLIALGQAGVGHVATLRDAAHATSVRTDAVGADPAAEPDEAPTARPTATGADALAGPVLETGDVQLALRYITDFTSLVAVHLPQSVLGEVIDAAVWGSARLVVVLDRDDAAASSLPTDAVAVLAVDDDADTALADALGRYAGALDRGDEPAAAYAAFVAAGTSPS